MPKSDSEHKVGLYECEITSDRHVVKKEKTKRIHIYHECYADIGPFKIRDDIMKYRDMVSQYPVLVISYKLYLEKAYPLKPGPYNLKGTTRKQIRDELGMSTNRQPKPGSEIYRVVIDEQGNIFPVDPNNHTIGTDPLK